MNLMQRVGNSFKSSLDLSMSTSICDGSVQVGDIIEVGQFFWINEDWVIGLDSDHRHLHGVNKDGSVDVDCTLEIRGIHAGWAIVRLDRERIPAGALASIGVVFTIPLSMIESWPEKIRRRKEIDSQRKELAARYCR